ncbi:hypothetical protein TSMEX_006858 [Taenia solium]
MKPEVFACTLQLLCGHDGEQCFEEARGETWFQRRLKSPFDEVTSILGLVSSRSELPMEALLMQRYARHLMSRNGEEHMSTVWDDPFISAEVYIQIKYLLGEITDATEIPFGIIGKAIHFEKPPLGFGEGSENSLNNKEASYALSKRALLENHQSDLSELPTSERMPLNIDEHHLIDVSNYFLEQSLRHGEALSASTSTSPAVVTQLFSPGQVYFLCRHHSCFNIALNGEVAFFDRYEN